MATYTRRPTDNAAAERHHDNAAAAAIGLLSLAFLLNPGPVASVVDVILPGWGTAVAIGSGLVLVALLVAVIVSLMADERGVA